MAKDNGAGSSDVRQFRIRRIGEDSAEGLIDTVAAEEPLEIRILYWFKGAQLCQNLALTMRTPGHDRELTAGFLVAEGIIQNREQLCGLRSIGGQPSNEIVAELAQDVDVETWRLQRNTFVNSSCGICGKKSKDSIAELIPAGTADSISLDPEITHRLPNLLRQHQAGFAQTGGLHAAALITPQGDVLAAFEDIGRHNALDKLVGWALLNGRLPLHESILFLSSRSSFELIQKTAMAGAPILATVGGPSSLAIEAAREYGITLIGFIRGGRFNVYSGESRLNFKHEAAVSEQQSAAASEST